MQWRYFFVNLVGQTKIYRFFNASLLESIEMSMTNRVHRSSNKNKAAFPSGDLSINHSDEPFSANLAAVYGSNIYGSSDPKKILRWRDLMPIRKQRLHAVLRKLWMSAMRQGRWTRCSSRVRTRGKLVVIIQFLEVTTFSLHHCLENEIWLYNFWNIPQEFCRRVMIILLLWFSIDAESQGAVITSMGRYAIKALVYFDFQVMKNE